MNLDNNRKVFPSGRSVEAVKKDAKRLKKSEGITLSQALDLLAKKNGVDLPWALAVASLDENPTGNN